MNCIARHALVHGGKKSSRAQPTCAAAAKKNATEEKVPCFYNYTMGFLSEKKIIFLLSSGSPFRQIHILPNLPT